MSTVKWSILAISLIFQSLNCDENTAAVQCPHKYIAVVDGGSSGTRIHVFKFEIINNYKSLIKGTNKKFKIALSQFSDRRNNWNILRQTFSQIINYTKTVIPNQCFKETSFHVRVTAGVRQMDAEMSLRILNEIRNILLKTDYIFKPEFVDILNTTYEGIFAWITVNILTNKLQQNNSDPLKTYGLLDLGGGSTQVAFATKNPELLSKTVKLKIYDQEYNIYTDGYDYMGMDETRMKYFNAQDCLRKSCGDTTANSQCLNPDVNGRYRVRNLNQIIKGKGIADSDRFCFCYGTGLKYIKPIIPIRHLFDNMEFVGISSFYYTLNNAKILKKNETNLGKTYIRDIAREAIKICQDPPKYVSPKKFEHFLCMDMSYVLSLLYNGYKFKLTDEFNAAPQILGISIDWPLGYGFSYL